MKTSYNTKSCEKSVKVQGESWRGRGRNDTRRVPKGIHRKVLEWSDVHPYDS